MYDGCPGLGVSDQTRRGMVARSAQARQHSGKNMDLSCVQ